MRESIKFVMTEVKMCRKGRSKDDEEKSNQITTYLLIKQSIVFFYIEIDQLEIDATKIRIIANIIIII